MLLSGSCHCANICLRLDWQPEPTEIPARACTCCFCTKHGGVWTSCPTASLEVVIKDPDRVSRYAFATRTALFHICSNCGVVPVVTRRVDDVLYAVVNVHALESVDRSLLRRASATFDEEDEADRLARRTRGWIGQVELIEGGS